MLYLIALGLNTEKGKIMMSWTLGRLKLNNLIKNWWRDREDEKKFPECISREVIGSSMDDVKKVE